MIKIPQYQSVLPQSNQYSSTMCELQTLKAAKGFNIAIAYSLLLTKMFREYLFPRVVLIYQEKATPMSIYFLGNYDLGVDISL